MSGFVALHNHIPWLESNTGIAAVPEPTTLAFLGGLALVALCRRRRSE